MFHERIKSTATSYCLLATSLLFIIFFIILYATYLIVKHAFVLPVCVLSQSCPDAQPSPDCVRVPWDFRSPALGLGPAHRSRLET